MTKKLTITGIQHALEGSAFFPGTTPAAPSPQQPQDTETPDSPASPATAEPLDERTSQQPATVLPGSHDTRHDTRPPRHRATTVAQPPSAEEDMYQAVAGQ
jgi:hypothetical protein